MIKILLIYISLTLLYMQIMELFLTHIYLFTEIFKSVYVSRENVSFLEVSSK